MSNLESLLSAARKRLILRKQEHVEQMKKQHKEYEEMATTSTDLCKENAVFAETFSTLSNELLKHKHIMRSYAKDTQSNNGLPVAKYTKETLEEFVNNASKAINDIKQTFKFVHLREMSDDKNTFLENIATKTEQNSKILDEINRDIEMIDVFKANMHVINTYLDTANESVEEEENANDSIF